jgi:hypothetical protein
VHFDTDAEELVGGVHASMVAGPRCRTHSHACEFRRSTHTKLVCGPRPHVDRPSRALLRLDRQSSRIAIQVTPAHRIPERPVQRGVYSPDCGWRQRGPVTTTGPVQLEIEGAQPVGRVNGSRTPTTSRPQPRSSRRSCQESTEQASTITPSRCQGSTEPVPSSINRARTEFGGAGGTRTHDLTDYESAALTS